jgi:hypothetical protein
MRCLILGFLLFSWSHRAQALPASIPASELLEKIEFHYSSSDGGFELDCKHWIGNFNAGDFSVACGKGTKWIRFYSVHLLIRQIPAPTSTSFEILYWVTDRNAKGSTPAFSSHSQLVTIDKNAKIKEFRMSQGIENDYAQMSLHYRP